MLECATNKVKGDAFQFVACARLVSLKWIALALILAGGCGGGERRTYRAGGKVTFPDGAPLTTGWVSFQPVDGTERASARGEIQPDGSFQLTTFELGDGAVPGRHRALVAAPVMQNMRWGPRNPSPEPLIDGRFTNIESSKLEFTVTDDPAKNQFTIVVTK